MMIPSLHSGGMERVMAILLWQFSKMLPESEFHLVLYGLKRDVFYEIPDRVVIHRPVFEFDNHQRAWHTLKTLAFLRKKISLLNPDAILSFGERWNNLVLLAGLGKNWPIYVSDRCQPDLSLGRFQDALRKWLYPKANGVIAQTFQARTIFQEMYQQNNIPVIGNPVKQVALTNHVQREKIVLNVGRLIHTKHQRELIELFLGINQPDWKLVIVGGDALKQQNLQKLRQLVKDKKAEGRIVLTGSQKEVETWYQKASLFAFPSSSEGFPNVVGEALAHGLPVIAFDCIAGPRDLIENGKNGFLIDMMDFEAFADRLKSLIHDESLRMKMAKYAPKSVERFSDEHIAQEFLTELMRAK